MGKTSPNPLPRHTRHLSRSLRATRSDLAVRALGDEDRARPVPRAEHARCGRSSSTTSREHTRDSSELAPGSTRKVVSLELIFVRGRPRSVGSPPRSIDRSISASLSGRVRGLASRRSAAAASTSCGAGRRAGAPRLSLSRRRLFLLLILLILLLRLLYVRPPPPSSFLSPASRSAGVASSPPRAATLDDCAAGTHVRTYRTWRRSRRSSSR